MSLSPGRNESGAEVESRGDQVPGSSPVKVVFVAGASYCGSTLLSFVLNTHSEILSIGEMGPSPTYEGKGYKCSCGAELSRCPFFLQVKEIMGRHGVPFDTACMQLRHRYSDNQLRNRILSGTLRNPLLSFVRDTVRDRIPRYRRRVRDFERRNEAFMRAALEVSKKRIFLDATKHPARIPFLCRMNVDLEALHLIRDPRGYCYSARKRRGTPVDVAAREWVRLNEQAEYYTSLLPGNRWKQVHYEALCRNPAERFSELARFMGAGDFVLPDDFRARPHHIIGNKMRESADARTTIRVDERWREGLSSADLRVVARLAGLLARRYGYVI